MEGKCPREHENSGNRQRPTLRLLLGSLRNPLRVPLSAGACIVEQPMSVERSCRRRNWKDSSSNMRARLRGSLVSRLSGTPRFEGRSGVRPVHFMDERRDPFRGLGTSAKLLSTFAPPALPRIIQGEPVLWPSTRLMKALAEEVLGGYEQSPWGGRRSIRQEGTRWRAHLLVPVPRG